MTTKYNRRDFLAFSAKGVGAAVLSYGLMGCSSDDKKDRISGQFLHGVASGDPASNAVILWTRVSPNEQGEVSVSWQVATDSDFSDVIRDGSMTTTAERDYTVKIDAVGLRPGQTYYYRFMSGDNTSTVGVTKTLPEGEIAQVKFAVLSCANYPVGYFNVYELATQQSEIDAVIHLGDYIYEYGNDSSANGTSKVEGREVMPDREIVSLDDYRQRYAQYRSDNSLQKLHQQSPFIMVWDDHEVTNDSYKDGAENHQEEEGDFAARKQAALQAYFEWLPIRPWREGRHEEIYRSFSYGDLLDLHMLDTRLLGRDKQLAFENYIDPNTGGFDGDSFMADVTDTNRTMLGLTQLLWLQGEMLQSTAKWQVLGQQVLMGKVFLPAAIATQQISISQFAQLAQLAQIAARAQAGDPTLTAGELQALAAGQHLLTPEVLAMLQLPSIPYNLDAWDGYAYEREVIFGTAKSRQQNFVVLAGDTHNAWANELRDVNGDVVGVEFATASVSSPGLEYYLQIPQPELPATEAAVLQLVEDLKYANMGDRGFMTVTFTPEKVESNWYYVDTVLSKEFKEDETKRQTKTMMAGVPELV
ncbi:alkaline phosphatase [Shewanella sp. OPT22]|nr:alkaline phosphatase [Shewanella sp. OPT22]